MIILYKLTLLYLPKLKNIEFVDTTKETLEIEPYISATDENGDFKHPENIKIQDASEYGISDSEEEEEE